MQVKLRSPQGVVTLVHLGTLVTAYFVYLLYFPVRPSEVTPNEMLVFNSAWGIIKILMFPLGYGYYLFPHQPELSVIWVGLMPLNSYLWGYAIIWISRFLMRTSRLRKT